MLSLRKRSPFISPLPLKDFTHMKTLVTRVVFVLVAIFFIAGTAFGSCASPANAIEAENCLPGTPSSAWYVSGAGDSTIQGFTTDMSVNVGQTVNFKVSTTASAY